MIYASQIYLGSERSIKNLEKRGSIDQEKFLTKGGVLLRFPASP